MQDNLDRVAEYCATEFPTKESAEYAARWCYQHAFWEYYVVTVHRDSYKVYKVRPQAVEDSFTPTED